MRTVAGTEVNQRAGDEQVPDRSGSRIDRLLRLVENLCVGCSALALVAMTALMVLEVLLRYLFDSPLSWSLAFITDYLLVAMFFLGLAHTFRVGGHVRIDIAFRRLPRRSRRVLDVTGNVLSLLFFALICYAGLTLTSNAWTDGEIPPPGGAELSWPTWTSYVFVPLGAVVLLLRIVHTILSPSDDEESGI